MKFDYTIKNFRAFDAEGATFTISPITILTGTNSSGKSSMAKSLRLLNTYLRALKDDANIGKCYPGRTPLDFSNSELKLGSLDSNINFLSKINEKNIELRNEPVPEDLSCISFHYTVFSSLLYQDCSISLKFKGSDSFGEEQSDGIERYGWLSSLSIVSEDKGFELLVEFEEGKPLIKKFNRTTARDFFYVYLEEVTHAFPPQFNNSDANDTIVHKTQIYNDLKWKYFSNIDPEERSDASADESLLLIPDEFLMADATTFFGDILKRPDSSSIAKIAEKIQADYHDSGAVSLLVYIRQKEEAWIKELSIDRKQSQFDDKNPREFFHATRKVVRLKEELEYYSLDYLVKNCKEITFPIIARFFKEVSGPLHIGLLYNNFMDFCNDIIKEALFPDSLVNLTYISSARASVKRFYTLNEASEPFDKLLSKYFQLSQWQSNDPEFKPGDFISRWINTDRPNSFGIGKKLSFYELAKGMAVVPYLLLGVSNGGEVDLADLGYGVTQLLSMLISIEVDIIEKMQKSSSGKLPVSYMVIEEPEIHLHPRLQSLLADMFLEAYLKYNIHFIIETHSEYLIRKYQYLVAEHSMSSEAGVDPSDICIYYLYDADPAKRPEGQQQVQPILIRENGKLTHKFGKGFIDISTDLVLELYATRGQYAD